MSTPYSITINIDPATLATLTNDGYQLYGFKTMQGPPGGYPLVWFATSSFSEQTVVSWTEQYYAYVSTTTDISPDTVITASSSIAADLGQLVIVANGGVLSVAEGPDPEGIAIESQASTGFSCGLAQQQGSSTVYSPTCAFPLPQGMEDIIVPIVQVFLMFSTEPIDTGQVLEQSYSWGALINLTAQNNMTASFSLSNSTQWVQAPGVTPYAPNTQMVPLLIPASTSQVVSAD